MSDVADPRDETAPEILPPDLLPIHQRLEHDGGSWRAALPPPDTLLHRVRAGSPQDHPPREAYREDRVAFRLVSLPRP
jgi:hypothetical protein